MPEGEFCISALTFSYLDDEIYLADGKKRLLAKGLAWSAIEFSFFIHRAESMDEVDGAYAYAYAFAHFTE
jgi:hypothetical protein